MSVQIPFRPMFPARKLGAARMISRTSRVLPASRSSRHHARTCSTRTKSLSSASAHSPRRSRSSSITASTTPKSGPGIGGGSTWDRWSSTRSQWLCSRSARASIDAPPRPPDQELTRMPASNSTRNGSASASSVSNWARTVLHHRLIRTDEATSSRTSTTGGSPASTGCSARIRRANECKVPMAAASRSATSSGWVSESSARRRSRSSEAAASLKVTAALLRIATPSSTS